ncbi:MAG: hemerythrin family protein [Pseudomonadota bacterium]
MQNHPIVDWNEKFSVDIPEIDELQKKMFKLLHVLLEMKDNKSDAKDCSNMIAEINEYSRYYFSKEEEYLRNCAYPEIKEHAREHRHFIKSTISLRRQVVDDKNTLSSESIVQLMTWLENHILNSDLMYVPFMRINRYIRECKGGN